MATHENPGRRKTFTEQARKAQLIGIAHDLVADRGYQGTSLQAIADAAGVTKAAVLYYFPSKAAVIRAAYEEVIAAVAIDISAAIEEAPKPALAPAAYIRAMIGHLDEHPEHVRILAEAAMNDSRPYSRRERWQPLADLIETSVAHRDAEASDARTLAVIIGGAIDGIIAEKLDDPSFDCSRAAERLIAMLPTATDLA